jgi:hypothetical protein
MHGDRRKKSPVPLSYRYVAWPRGEEWYVWRFAMRGGVEQSRVPCTGPFSSSDSAERAAHLLNTGGIEQ